MIINMCVIMFIIACFILAGCNVLDLFGTGFKKIEENDKEEEIIVN